VNWEHLNKLESKINQVVSRIENLQIENQKLLDATTKLRSESQSQEILIQQLKEENLNQTKSESSFGKEKEEKIRNKVEQMLTMLDELH
jgi:FtsZ-binding cell division protein ZapB